MNKKMAKALIEEDCFEAVMTAMRGPDQESEAELKESFTAILRWAVGFDYGFRMPPRTRTWWALGALAEVYEESHFSQHVWAAFHSLSARFGWTPENRIPLVAYVDPCYAKEEAAIILSSAIRGSAVDSARDILSAAREAVRQANDDDPDFKLDLASLQGAS